MTTTCSVQPALLAVFEALDKRAYDESESEYEESGSEPDCNFFESEQDDVITGY